MDLKIKDNDKLTLTLNQLELIDNINKMINIAKDGNDNLGIRQYEHLKKQYIKNLHKLLAENYQIPMPKLETK